MRGTGEEHLAGGGVGDFVETGGVTDLTEMGDGEEDLAEESEGGVGLLEQTEGVEGFSSDVGAGLGALAVVEGSGLFG